jgi:hypothetical protein
MALNGQGPPITARRMAAIIKGLRAAGLDPQTVRVDPTDTVEVTVNTGAAPADEVDIGAILDRRIAKTEQARSVTREGARPGRKPGAGAQSGKLTKEPAS